jgi:hypothetical protein
MDESTIRSVADATKAVAETGSKALEIANSIGRIVKGPVIDLIGIVEDRVKYARWERQLALADKAEAIMRNRKLAAPTRNLPLNFAVPLLTHAILEEDDELQEVWARLLVNAGDASTEMELRVAYVSILDGMSAFDVKNLSLMARASLDTPEKGYLPIIETWNLPHSAKVHEESSKDTGVVSKELAYLLEISIGWVARHQHTGSAAWQFSN